MSPSTPSSWSTGVGEVALDRPLVMGILNVTPDSFSDGGRFLSVDGAVACAEVMHAEGADIIDVGGESTRPQGATPVDVAEECRRVLPVIGEIRRRFPEVVVSVDTVKAEVAERALGEGAAIVNDVSALRLDSRMGEVCARARAGVVLMHSRGGVSDMATFAHAAYGDDVVGEVLGELMKQVRVAEEAGVARKAIVLDPGIGFSKRSEHSLAVLTGLPRIVDTGFPVLVGVSRKRFIGELTGVRKPAERVHGTIGANVMALVAGARIFRVHDVGAARQALDVAWAILQREMQT
ncbi:MAG TPA: dihydropteroate synthase [Gemmatimonadaceae bacterium]|nr:dihydropteroate synthase [Gemmatimonadaceae bacterium]